MAAPIFVSQELVGAAKLNSLPKGVLGYAEVTANQTGITTEVDLTGLSVTVDVAASRRIRITGKGFMTGVSNIDRANIIYIKEGTTYFNEARVPHITTGIDCLPQAIITPSSGSHTYKLATASTVGTGAFNAAAGRPGFILVEDIGGV